MQYDPVITIHKWPLHGCTRSFHSKTGPVRINMQPGCHLLFNTFSWLFILRSLTCEFWDEREHCRRHPIKSARVEEEANWKKVGFAQGSTEHNMGQTAQIVQYVKVTVNLASSSCNTTRLLELSGKYKCLITSASENNIWYEVFTHFICRACKPIHAFFFFSFFN